MNHFYLTTYKTSRLALALKSNVSKTKCMAFSGLAVSALVVEDHDLLMWSGQDNRGSKGDHLQDLIQRIPQ